MPTAEHVAARTAAHARRSSLGQPSDPQLREHVVEHVDQDRQLRHPDGPDHKVHGELHVQHVSCWWPLWADGLMGSRSYAPSCCEDRRCLTIWIAAG